MGRVWWPGWASLLLLLLPSLRAGQGEQPHYSLEYDYAYDQYDQYGQYQYEQQPGGGAAKPHPPQPPTNRLLVIVLAGLVSTTLQRFYCYKLFRVFIISVLN